LGDLQHEAYPKSLCVYYAPAGNRAAAKKAEFQFGKAAQPDRNPPKSLRLQIRAGNLGAFISNDGEASRALAGWNNNFLYPTDDKFIGKLACLRI
jgi:hypothetical protein